MEWEYELLDCLDIKSLIIDEVRSARLHNKVHRVLREASRWREDQPDLPQQLVQR